MTATGKQTVFNRESLPLISCRVVDASGRRNKSRLLAWACQAIEKNDSQGFLKNHSPPNEVRPGRGNNREPVLVGSVLDNLAGFCVAFDRRPINPVAVRIRNVIDTPSRFDCIFDRVDHCLVLAN
jgi:hypothetical protein